MAEIIYCIIGQGIGLGCMCYPDASVSPGKWYFWACMAWIAGYVALFGVPK